MNTRLKFRKMAYPTPEELQPFINSHEVISSASPDEIVTAQLDSMSSRVPYNAESIRLGEIYRGELPGLLESKLTETREFFLKEVTPYLLSCANGLQDAQDVLQAAFEETPDTGHLFTKIENAVALALDLKILHFAKKFTGLDENESRQFLTLAFAKELKSNDNIQAIMHALQSLPYVPGPNEGAKVPVRPLPKAKRGRQPAGTGRAGTGTKGRVPRGSGKSA